MRGIQSKILLMLGAISLVIEAGGHRALADEEALGPMPDPHLIAYIAISIDCCNVAMVQRSSSRSADVWLNGKLLHAVSWDVPIISISPDGQHTVYISSRQKNLLGLVVDGDEAHAPRYDAMVQSPDAFLFSPDSKHFAYAARRANDWFVVLDGKEGAHGDAPPSGFLFNSDSRRLAYIMQKENKKYVVVDGSQSEGYLDVKELCFSSDGRHMAYSAKVAADQWIAVVDGSKSAVYSSIDHLRINRDGTRSAFSATVPTTQPADDRYVMVVDGKASDRFSNISVGPVFSDDGSHLAYQSYYVTVFDGKATVAANRIQEIVYSPDGAHLAYVNYETDTPGGTLGARQWHYTLVIDHKRYTSSAILGRSMGGFTWSPDSKRVSCAILPIRNGELGWRMTINGEAGSPYRSVGPAVFSPDSKHVAYAAQKDSTWIMVLDEQELPYELLRPTVDNGPDGRWKTVDIPDLRMWASENGVDYGPHREDFAVAQIPYCFDKDNKLNFIGIREGKIYRVTQ